MEVEKGWSIYSIAYFLGLYLFVYVWFATY